MPEYEHRPHTLIDIKSIDPTDNVGEYYSFQSVYTHFSALKEARDSILREQWIKAMEARLVRQAIEKCYRSEGVNHYENCKGLVDTYRQMVQENKVRGWKDLNFD